MAFGRKKTGATNAETAKRFEVQRSGSGFGRANKAAQQESALWTGAKTGLKADIAKSMGVGHDARMDRVVDLLNTSPTGAALLEQAHKDGVVLEIDRSLDSSGAYLSYGDGSAKIMLNGRESAADNVNTLSHELRHHWQDKNGITSDASKTPKENIHMTRLREADAEAVSLQVSSELFQNGYQDSFFAHKKGAFSKMADAYLGKNIENRDNMKNGNSMKAAFDAWFDDSTIIDSYDGHSISQMGATYNKKIPDNVVDFTAKDLLKIGELPNGFNYLDGEDARDLTSDEYDSELSKSNKEELGKMEGRYSPKGKENSASPKQQSASGNKPENSATPMLGKPKQKSFGRRQAGAINTKENTLSYKRDIK